MEPQLVRKEVFKKGNILFECNFKTNKVREAILEDDPLEEGSKRLVFDPDCIYLQAFRKDAAEKMFAKRVKEISMFVKRKFDKK